MDQRGGVVGPGDMGAQRDRRGDKPRDGPVMHAAEGTDPVCAHCTCRSARPVWAAGGTAVVECDGCGLRYLWPRLAPHVEHESYFRELYLPQFAPGGEGDAARGDVRRAIADIERFVPVGRLLDVGCATGEFLRAAAERGWQGTGVELAPWAVEYGRRRYSLDIRQGELTEIELPEGSFDAVLMSEVVEHLPNPTTTLARAARLLRPGGVLWLSTPNADSHAARVLGDAWDRIEPTGHLFYFTPRTLRAMLTSAGLRTVELRTPLVDFEELAQRAAAAGRPMPGDGERLALRAMGLVHAALRRLRPPPWRVEGDRLGRGETIVAVARR